MFLPKLYSSLYNIPPTPGTDLAAPVAHSVDRVSGRDITTSSIPHNMTQSTGSLQTGVGVSNQLAQQQNQHQNIVPPSKLNQQISDPSDLRTGPINSNDLRQNTQSINSPSDTSLNSTGTINTAITLIDSKNNPANPIPTSNSGISSYFSGSGDQSQSTQIQNQIQNQNQSSAQAQTQSSHLQTGDANASNPIHSRSPTYPQLAHTTTGLNTTATQIMLEPSSLLNNASDIASSFSPSQSQPQSSNTLQVQNIVASASASSPVAAASAAHQTGQSSTSKLTANNNPTSPVSLLLDPNILSAMNDLNNTLSISK